MATAILKAVIKCYVIQHKGFFAVVDVSMRELASQLGYKKVSGADYRRLLNRIKELIDFPIMISDNFEAYTFTFLGDIIIKTYKKGKKNRIMLRLTFNPFISKQLYERKAFLRSSECYKIVNPTAFKFLITYDKRIVKGNSLRLEIHEVAKDLEMETINSTHIMRMMKTTAKELNGFELNDNYQLRVELIKEKKEWFVVAERVLKEKREPKESILRLNAR